MLIVGYILPYTSRKLDKLVVELDAKTSRAASVTLFYSFQVSVTTNTLPGNLIAT